jgi:hypothetical protein
VNFHQILGEALTKGTADADRPVLSLSPLGSIIPFCRAFREFSSFERGAR